MNSLATVHGCVWLPRKSEGLSGIAASSILARGAQSFRVRVRMRDTDVAPPIGAVFSLEVLGTTTRRKGSLAFAWTHRGGFPLPSMRGEFVTRRFGPLVSLLVRAKYEYDDGPAGRLFHEAVGDRLARKAFKTLMAVIKHVVLDNGERPLLIARDEPTQPSRRRSV